MKVGFFDWTEKKLSLYVFDKEGNRYTFTDTLSVPIEDELNRSFLTSFAATNIEQVYLSIPSNLLSLRELSFPFSDRNKIKDTIAYELEGIMLGDIDDYSIDYLMTESSEDSSRVLTAGMEKIKLRDIIDLFTSVGLEPVIITSVDLRGYSNIETLFESPVLEEDSRIEAVRGELENPSINLRQKELAYKGDIERVRKSLRLTGVLVFLLLVMLGLGTAVNFMSLKKENVLLTNEITAVYRDAFPEDSKIVNVERQFKGNLSALMEKKAVLGGISVLDIMRNIANLKNKNIKLNELNIDEKNILLKGTALSFENVDSFKNILSTSFAEVRVIDSKASPDKKISFSIIMKEKMT